MWRAWDLQLLMFTRFAVSLCHKKATDLLHCGICLFNTICSHDSAQHHPVRGIHITASGSNLINWHRHTDCVD